MYGAVIGDIVGSVYEWNNIYTKEFPLFSNNGKFTDSTILTMAAAEWILDGGNPEIHIRRWGTKYNGRDVIGRDLYRKSFREWLADPEKKILHADPNGAVMRVSPIPFLIADTDEALQRAMEFTMATHSHPDTIRAVRAYVTTMHDIYAGMDTKEIKRHIAVDFSFDTQRPFGSLRYKKLVFSRNDLVSDAIICALDAVSFEDAIRNAVSLGADSDSLACMSGALAEALFGIPKDIGKMALPYLDDSVRGVLSRLYSVRPKSLSYFQ